MDLFGNAKILPRHYLSMRLVLAVSILVGACGNQQGKSAVDAKSANIAATNKSATLAAAATVSSVSKSMNGPFGIEIGAALDNLGQTTKMDTLGLYRVDTPPKPHSAFASVVVIAYPGTGVCVIRGIGHNISNDGAGLQTRSAVDELAETLKLKYGAGHKIDRCFGSGSCNSEYWMMYMKNNERYYGYEFNGGSDAMKAAKLVGIDVAAYVSDINTGSAIVEYTGNNKAACQAAAKLESADAL